MPTKVIIGDAELWLGDCLHVLYALRPIDATITDPPYGVNLTAKQNKWVVNIGTGYESYEDTPENVTEICVEAIKRCIEISDRVIVTPGTRNMWSYPKPDDVGTIFNRCGAGRGPWGFNGNNPILYYGKCPYLAHGMGSRPNSWDQPVNDYAEKLDHPCPKPMGMMNWLVERGSLAGETVLDPFMGTGTTGMACVTLGRKFIGIEIEPKYFDIACKRIRFMVEQQKQMLFPPVADTPIQPSLEF